MSLVDTIQSDLRQAMKQGEVAARDALRLLLSYMKNAAIDFGKEIAELSDEEVTGVIRKEIKKRQDSIAAFVAGGRAELADKEQEEISLFEKYVPAQMSADDIDQVVQEVVDSLGDAAADFGKVMGQVMGKLKGKADGTLVSERVKALLEK